MRILQVITGMRKAAGTSVFAGEVANELVAQGHEVVIAVVDPRCDDCYRLDPQVKLIGLSKVVVADYDIVHIHALWAPILSKIAKVAHKAGVKVIWSPHGMLTPWALKNKRWKKCLGLALYQYWALRKADVLHATAQSEVEDIRRLGLKNRVVVVPLGVRAGKVGEGSGRGTKDGRVLLFVSRVQRKKGLPNLLEAWARLPDELKKEWTIRIVGPDQEGHVSQLKSQAENLGIAREIVFVGPLYDEALAAEYAGADLFVLPTHSENFGSVVIEALAHGVPVICTKGAPWEELESCKCGWWIDIGVDPLAEALLSAVNLSREDLNEMGLRGRKLVARKYTWSAVCDKMIAGYEEVLKG